MNRGHIVRWHYVNEIDNRGVLVGCSLGVHGLFFSFTIHDVVDPVLANFLRMTPSIVTTPSCGAPPSPLWVFFTPVGPNVATSLSRIFH